MGKTYDSEPLKRELTGIAFMMLSVYLIILLLNFHAEDNAGLATIAWRDIFSKAARDAAETIHNPFGPLGVKLSSFFIRTYGYLVILPLTAMFFWGWSLFRAKSLKPALVFFLYSVILSVDIASMFGLTSAPSSDIMAGSIGRMLAEKLKVIGEAGAWFLLSVLSILLIPIGRVLLAVWLENRSNINDDKQLPREDIKYLLTEGLKWVTPEKPSPEFGQPLYSEPDPVDISTPNPTARISGEPEMIIQKAVHEEKFELVM